MPRLSASRICQRLTSLRREGLFKKKTRRAASRVTRFEQLEHRRVLAAAIWHNVSNRLNVNGDSGGFVSPLDALLVINELNGRNISDPLSGVLPKQVESTDGVGYLDVSCDGYVAPIDALLVIDYLNAQGSEEPRGALELGTGLYPALACSPQLQEQTQFATEFVREFTLPNDSTALRISFQAPEFDLESRRSIRDAFEIEVTDFQGNPLSFPYSSGRDAVYNWSEDLEPVFGAGVSTTTEPSGADSTATINLSGLAAGTQVRVTTRLVNNDGDDDTSTLIRGFEFVDALLPAPEGVSASSQSTRELAPLDFSKLQDLSGSFAASYGRTSLAGDNTELVTELMVTNLSSQAVTGRLLVAIDNVSELDVHAMHPDGFLQDGRPYFDLTSEMDGQPLAPGASIRSREIRFLNESGDRFSYKLSTLGTLNVAPSGFSSTPVDSIEAGNEYRYAAHATDPDGQTLTYSMLVGPERATIDPATGVLQWSTDQADIGSHRITLRATDPFGLYVEQSYTITVHATLQNRPPNFVSDPVTEAIASSGFEITTVATGAGPAGVSVINGFRGPGLVTLNAGDQSLSQIDSLGNDLFDLPIRVSVGEPAPTGQVLRSGYSVDVGLPAFESTFDRNAISGMDQADLNGDGTLDLVVSGLVFDWLPTQTYQQLINVTLGNPDGTFGEAITVGELPAKGNSKYSTLRVADFDNDGDFDILTTDGETSTMHFLRGNGQGDFADAVSTTLTTNLYNFKSVDLDQDGNLDLVGMSNTQKELGYMLGRGDGTFDDFVTVYGDPAGPLISSYFGPARNYAVADMDGDGDRDIVLGDFGELSITVMSNDGALGFSVAATLDAVNPFYPYASPGPPKQMFAVFLGDFNGDSHEDIAYGSLYGSSSRSGGLGVYLGDGSGTNFTYQDGADAIVNFPDNAAGNGDPVDIDNDGDLDIVVASSRGGTGSAGQMPSVLINRGDGTFTTTNLTLPAFGESSYAFTNNESNAKGVLVGDYNQDGLLDISTYRSHIGGSFASVTVILADQPGVFASSSTLHSDFLVNSPKAFYEAGDFNNDGIVDLWAPSYQGISRTWLGRGHGTFDDPFPATPSIGNEFLTSGTVEDFNQDGILDVFWNGHNGVQGGPAPRYLAALGNGDGTFEITFQESSGGRQPAWSDFNGDGYLDFASSNTTADGVQVFLYDVDNPGTWVFDNEILYSDLGPGATGHGYTMSVDDFDQDGKSDIGVVARLTDEPFRLVVYPGLGDGTFTTPVSTFIAEAATDYTSTSWMTTGDFNEDGIPDVAVYEYYSISVHLGVGDGTFGRTDIYPAWRTANLETQLFVRDINHDGHDDVLFTDVQGSQSLGILLGNGDGSFQDRIAYDVPNSYGAISFGDFDNDGREDVVANGQTLGNFATILNGARQRLTDIVSVDLNGDGNDDVLATNTDNSRVKWFLGDNLGNLNRQPDLFTDFGPVALTVFDLDQNGVTEIVTANRSARSISIFSGGVDNWTRNDIAVGRAPVDVLSGFVNDDDSSDLLVIDEVNNALWVLMGNGDITFNEPVAVPLGDRPNDFLLADVSADGNNDVVLSLPDSNRIMILPGDGLGGFDAPQYVALSGSPSALAAVDFNDDGNLDLSATLGDLNQVAIIYGRGGNQFARPQLITVGDNPVAMSAEDADGDGRIDLIVSNQGDDTVSVIYNRFDPNEVYRYDADAVDPDGDPLTYAIVDGPGGLIINGETGALLWAASPDQVGEHSVTISADDGRGGVATQTYKIDVQPARENATPLFATQAETTIGANEVFTYQATALDSDNDAIRYRLLDGPAGATIDPTTGLVTWDGRGEARKFTEFGENGSIRVAADESYQTPSVTVDGWFNIHTLTASNGAALLFSQQNGPGYAYYLRLLGNDRIQFTSRFDSGSIDYRAPFVQETDRWYHIALTIDDASHTATIYVDGEVVGETALPSSIQYASDDPLVLTGGQSTVDNFRVWSVARSQAEIQQGMAEQYDDNPLVTLDYRFDNSTSYSAYDSSQYGNAGYLTGAVPQQTVGLTVAGERSFTISVEDGRGGFDTQTFVSEVLPELRGSIVGHLFEDLNGDGDQDDGSEDTVPAEPSLENWHLYIDTNGNAYPDPGELQTLTDADGNYRFDDLLPGEYPVRVSPVAAYEVPIDATNVTASANTETAFDSAIEQLTLSHVRGRLETASGDAIAYWKAFADIDGDGTRGENEPLATSDRNGNYALTGLDAGNYTIRADVPPGWADAAGRDGLTVTLAADEVLSGNDFVLQPTNTSVTGGVHFVTTPGSSIEARQTFRYASVAIGIADEAIVYDLSLAPDGMTIDPNKGLVAWRPTIDQVGEHLVILRATNASGSISLHDFYLDVTAPNTPPAIVAPSSGIGSLPVLTSLANVGLSYVYDIIAQDAESTELTYALTQSPAGATIDPVSGRLNWLPAASAVGPHDFIVEVTDEAGATTTATWTVDVLDTTPTVLPLRITLPRLTATVTADYFSRISATDQLGRPVSWAIISGPESLTLAADGTLNWKPAASQLGEQTVEVTATTADNNTQTVSLTIEVIGFALNASPDIASEPITSVALGQGFVYDVMVSDADHDIFAFTLLEAPVGMSVHPTLGTIRWTPAADQLGESDVLIQVSDPSGATDEQTFKLKVSRFGGPPRLVSVPLTEAAVGTAFLYSVGAVDREGDPLTYALLAAPEGMTISETTGEVSWTPTVDQLGEQDLVIQVSDGIGGAVTQAFVIRVAAGRANSPPIISSTAGRFGSVGTAYSYTLAASDPESTAINFSVGRGPDGLTVDASAGVVTWTPTAAQVGQHVVTLIATDAGGASAVESYELDILAANTVPVINSSAPAEVAAGAEFRYDVLASDADLDQLLFELIDAPTGVTIDRFGRVRWQTKVPLIGSHDFKVQVSDPRGGQIVQDFTLDVIEDSVAPKLSAIVFPGESPVGNKPWGTQFRVFVRAIDNVAIASLTLKANGQDIPLDAAGTAEFRFDKWGFSTITATATAIDTNGNITTKTNTFAYDFPEGWDGQGGDEVPTALITSPADSAAVTGMVSIVGTASHDDFAAYKLSYRHVDESSFTEFFESITPVTNGELGVWDTSLLLNDEYVIRLQVVTTDAVVNVTEHHVGLAGELKLGNFRLSFTDMVIPVAGIPLEITRIYDTLQADREGDFGYGWRLEYRNTDLRVGLPKSGLEDIGIYSALRAGVKVYLNVPGQGRQGFTFNPDIRVLPGWGGNNLVLARPRFTPDPGVTSTLSTGVSQYLHVNEQGELYAPGGIPYNPASPDFGGAYVLTTRDGIAYRVDGASGKLNSATDRNGNRIVFSDNEILGDGLGVNVRIERDSRGRITKITNQDDSTLQYGYAEGNLVSATDANGNVVKFTYNNVVEHYLEEIVDPLDRPITRLSYDQNGRVERIIDVNGNATTILVDPGNATQVVTDALGQTEFFEYNEFGSVQSYVDGIGNVTSYQYDSGGRLVETTDALGNSSRIEREVSGRPISIMLPNGAMTVYQYDHSGNRTSIVDPLGNRTEMQYDDRGNLTSIAQEDRTHSFAYDNRGRLTVETDARGFVVVRGYDVAGNVVAQTNPEGLVSNMVYNSLGRVTATSSEVTLGGQQVSLQESNVFDRNGNRIFATDVFGAKTTFEYTASNQVSAILNADGNRFELSGFDNSVPELATTPTGETVSTTFDAIGQAVSMQNTVGGAESYRYDASGNLVERILPPAVDGGGSEVQRFQYDAVGNLIAIADSSGGTRYEYDTVGNRTSQIDAAGNRTAFRYDLVGRISEVVDAGGGTAQINRNAFGEIESVVYPDGGDVQSQYDKGGNLVQSIDATGNVHRFEYDGESRLVRTIGPDGAINEYDYNALGGLVRHTNPLGESTLFERDGAGRILQLTMPTGETSEFRYTIGGQLESRTDFEGITTSYSYDLAGNLDRIQSSNGDSYAYQVSAEENTIVVEHPGGSETYRYDDRNRLVSHTNANGHVVNYIYDQASRVTRLVTETGFIQYEYNLDSSIASVSDGTTTVSLDYDTRGNLIAKKFSSGTSEYNTYDTRNRLLTRSVVNGEGLEVIRLSHEYDSFGNVLVRETLIDGEAATETFEYDENVFLIRWQRIDSDGVEGISWEYDDAGNRVREVRSDGEIVEYTYDESNRLVERQGAHVDSYTYNENGSLIQTERDAQQYETFEWNPLGQLLLYERLEPGNQTTIQYEYDHVGNRIATTVDGERSEHVHALGADLPVLLETRDANSGRHTTYVDAGGLLWQSDDQGATNFYHTDLVDSVIGLTDLSGQVVNLYSYDPYGNELDATVTQPNPFTFAGGYQDIPDGPIQMRARHYDRKTGRFVSVDPNNGTIEDPFSLHRYIYGRNNPVAFSDPSGRTTSFTEVAVASGIIGGLAAIGTGVAGYVTSRYFDTVDWSGTSFAGTFDPKASDIAPGTGPIGTSVGLQLNVMHTENGPNPNGDNTYDTYVRAASGTIIAGISAGPNFSWPASFTIGGFEVSVARFFATPSFPSLALAGPYLLVGQTTTVLGAGYTLGSTLIMGFGIGNADGWSDDLIASMWSPVVPTGGFQISITGGVSIPLYDSNLDGEAD
ncbi:putative Ig domain-containing protein [Aureliella helgolandensis]|uniref:tRNA(Glu)-specific nuclease WapA n=1 Tax=Aureliella helgolandensis TaxID=2527968 RepID=A0A518G776_9BACT|nr:putative Ig domain-containing protein [Aureliella helgolandensis]QDV24439.1 tRNA(Glu)-specific nuclease WapA precursor [Aureliella helgolandensis]